MKDKSEREKEEKGERERERGGEKVGWGERGR